ncbi:MAG: hypothetical protein RL357_1360 [Pseudomonadota bacterium]
MGVCEWRSKALCVGYGWDFGGQSAPRGQSVPDLSLKVFMLHCEQLYKQYGDTPVVRDLSFSIRPGECMGIIGPNGAGKTTTIRMCLGLTPADRGQVRYVGPDGSQWHMPDDALTIKQSLGVVSQMDTLDPDFSCAENIRIYGRYFGLSSAELDHRVPELLDFAVLSHKAKARPGDLSGGMKRRLSLARALVNRPRLLLLDEPTTGLDPQARHLMWERLQALLQTGTSILLTTHFMDEAERLCNRLLVLDHGQKITEGTPRELIQQHIEPEVIEVYGAGATGDAARLFAHLADRTEQSGETLFLYTRHAHALMSELAQHPNWRTLHRPANLEDVFLKLTGRQIREEA